MTPLFMIDPSSAIADGVRVAYYMKTVGRVFDPSIQQNISASVGLINAKLFGENAVPILQLFTVLILRYR
jgi:hypothetical protein